MAYISHNDEMETVVSSHGERRWQRRERELADWAGRPKIRKRAKQTVMLGNIHIDAELLAALTLFKRMHIETEFSCAGVSPLDEPEDHSLYAYITFPASERTERFVKLAMKRMKHRLLVTFEPARNRYDLSSFYIGHNRSFCLLMEHCARVFMKEDEARSKG
jgi:hypothetical protein